MSTESPWLVVIAGTTISANSIETIGPIKEEETSRHDWFRQTFRVSTRCGYVVQWKGARYWLGAGATAEQEAHAESCRATADKARSTLVRAVWPELSEEDQRWV